MKEIFTALCDGDPDVWLAVSVFLVSVVIVSAMVFAHNSAAMQAEALAVQICGGLR